MADEQFTLMHHPELKAEHAFPKNPRVLARKESEGWVMGPFPAAKKERDAEQAAQDKAAAAVAKAAEKQEA